MIPKFRAWDKYRNEMYKVRSISFETEEIATDSEQITFETVIIMQSTGLYDRNGVEVYEDDIVRCSRGCPHRVIWVKEYGGSFLGGMPAWYLFGLNEGYSWTGAEEIIGNSWENLELLEDVE